ncbi:monooxygenase [Aspergillus ustus]|uniref:Monooxygenase n=1 Tax=Aspergillus ustus TaxID=40382 RepID=A0A0C1C437_ASPUT|nr:monooxygenase [Aspergillus ustus]
MAPRIKSVAIIGAGPAGAIAVDAFAQEHAFDRIRVFERREKAGGCWIYDEDAPAPLADFDALTARTADKPVAAPGKLPGYFQRSQQHRFDDTPVYPALEANIDADIMQFSQEAIPEVRSAASVKLHGPETPFRHHTVIQKYIESLVTQKGYSRLVEYNTTVENAEKREVEGASKWVLTLRKQTPGLEKDYWWQEEFDALVVATGHYTVPYVPQIKGLKEFAAAAPGSVIHTKAFRHPESYRGKKVITVGASVSGADTAVSLVGIAEGPIYAVVRGKYNGYFGDEAFKHPQIQRKPPISHIEGTGSQRTVHFEDGTSVTGVDHIILGTGYTWTLPFLPSVPTRNNRVPDLYLHIFHQSDPTLAFIGAVAAGFTFKVFEWQSVLAARVFAGKATLPPLEEQKDWEAKRIEQRGDGVKFTLISPDFEQYFELLRKLATEPKEGEPGRRLPKFDPTWVATFAASHQRRIKMWKRANEEAAKGLERQRASKL